ncbi:hypothetical protein FS749_011587 [Ceratobasidium sp. UAMH 11750]|nr:hypothetical protein FS749_011587 [Ceratobasidium sp. UAMH 11750]
MDGTLFVRVGGLLMGAMNWEFVLDPTERTTQHEDDVDGKWDRAGLGWDEAWE